MAATNRISGRKRVAVDLNFPTSPEGGNRPKKVPKRKMNVKFTTDPTGSTVTADEVVTEIDFIQEDPTPSTMLHKMSNMMSSMK